MGRSRSYCNGRLVWYDYVDGQAWCMNDLETIVEDLGYEMAGRLNVFFMAVDKPVGSVLSVLKTSESFKTMFHWVVLGHRSLLVHIDHDESIRGDDWDDVVTFPVAKLPPVISPKKIVMQNVEQELGEGEQLQAP